MEHQTTLTSATYGPTLASATQGPTRVEPACHSADVETGTGSPVAAGGSPALSQTTVIPFMPKSYDAKLSVVHLSGHELHIAGTLDGFIDFAIGGKTYSFTCDDARTLIAALHATVGDIQTNCLFDRDPLLMKDTP